MDAEYYSYDEALAEAHGEAVRGLEATEHSLCYVAYLPDFYDYCWCEFTQEKDGWSKSVRALTPTERLPEEAISDGKIAERARAGDKITAVRLYRTKHGVGLKEALAAIERLLSA